MISVGNIARMGASLMIVMVTLVLLSSVLQLQEKLRETTGALHTMIEWFIWFGSWGGAIASIGFMTMIVCLIPALIPPLVHKITTMVLLRTNPKRVQRITGYPHVEIHPHSYDRVFLFQTKWCGLRVWIFDYTFPVYQSEVNPDVLEWCDSMMIDRPQVFPRQVVRVDSGVRIFLRFNHPNDAMAFKLRWL